METHYWKEIGWTEEWESKDFSYHIENNMFWADYANFLV